MKPISGHIELPYDKQDEERFSLLKINSTGLGPSDLVVLKKESIEGTHSTFYYTAGIPLSSEESIVSYVKDLKSRIPHKSMGKRQYSLSEVNIFVWNAFSKYDVHIKIDSNMEISVSAFNLKNKEIDFSAKMWNEISISSRLRYWIPYDELFRSLYNLKSVNLHPLNPYPNIELFSNSQLNLIIKKLAPSDDVDNSLALYFLATMPKQDFYTIIKKFQKHFPGIISAIFKYIPFDSNIAQKLYNYLIECFYQTPDDIRIAQTLMEISHFKKDQKIENQTISFFKNIMWSSPIACACCAKSFVESKQYDEAIHLLNAAFYAREFSASEMREYEVAECENPSGRAPRSSPRSIEKEIIESQLDSVNDFIHSVAYDLAKDFGATRLRTAIKKKLPTKEEDAELCFKGNTNVLSNNKRNGDELDLLFDPGVESESTMPKEFNKLPLAQGFADLVTDIVVESHEISKAKRNDSVSDQESARSLAVTALKTRDVEAMNISISFFEKLWRVRPVHYLMQMKLWAKTGGHMPELGEVNVKLTFGENNALMILEKIASNISTF